MTSLTDQHKEQARHKPLGPEDYERIQESLDSLDWNITEEEAEAILRANGTSGKEVVNGFIERLLKERQEAIDALSSRDAEVREVLEGLKNSFLASCWCAMNPPGHSQACLAARALYAKLQPLPSENPRSTFQK